MTQHTRRTVLRRGGMGIAGVMTASAGCLNAVNPFGPKQSYTDWLSVPEDDLSDYSLFLSKPASAKEHQSHLSDSLKGLLSSPKDSLSQFDIKSFEMFLFVESEIVIRATYDRSDIVSFLTQDQFTELETVNGYTLYNHRSRGPMAVSDDVLVFPYEYEPDSLQKIRALIEAKTGEAERLTEQNKTFKTLFDHLGGGDVIWTGRVPTYHTSEYTPLARVDGASFSIDGKTSRVKRVFVFDTEKSNNASTVKRYVRSNVSSASQGVSFSKEKNVLQAEMTIPTKDLSVEDCCLEI